MSPPKWRVRDGSIVAIADMSDAHLVNAVVFLVRVAPARLNAIKENALNMMGIVRSEMACAMASNDLDCAMEMTATDVLNASPFVSLLTEARRRGILPALADKGLDVAAILAGVA